MLRAVLLWLLILALPAQGALAATMAFCGPNHPGQAAAAAHHADAAHQSHAAAAHHHDAAADGHAATVADDTSPSDKFAQHDTQKCSVCAACCSAAAIYDALPQVPVLEPAAADFAAVVPAVEPFSADDPDRPPRHIPA